MVRKLDEKQLKLIKISFERWCENTLIEYHDEVYKYDSREPGDDDNLVEEYGDTVDSVSSLLMKELEKWGKPPKGK